MGNYIYTNEGLVNADELMHYGVPGMRWGRRKIQKWATSKHQPSSAKSSVLSGIYAATGNKKVGKALDKSNDRDAANWKRAKKEYADIKKTKTDKAVKNAKKKVTKENVAKAVKTGSKIAGTLLTASLMDDIFLGGKVKRTAGRAVVSAYVYANGGRDIRWYDN